MPQRSQARNQKLDGQLRAPLRGVGFLDSVTDALIYGLKLGDDGGLSSIFNRTLFSLSQASGLLRLMVRYQKAYGMLALNLT